MSGWRGARPRVTAWLDWESGAGVADTGRGFQLEPRVGAGGLLVALERTPAERVYVIGAPAGELAGWARLAARHPRPELALPDGWAVAPRGHHSHEVTPALRWRVPLSGRELEVRSAVEWFGPGAFTAGQARDAWAMLEHKLGRAFPGSVMLASPSTTGRNLLGLGGRLPDTLPANVIELLKGSAQQGRVERLAEPGRKVRGLAYLDARVSYGALCRELGSGPVTHDDVPELPLDARGKLTARGRLRVRVTVPDGWAHVGLFGVGPKPYRYPHAPGESFETWADCSEVALGLEHGWRVDVLERLLFEQGKPLDGWASRLQRVWRELLDAGDVEPEVRALAAFAVRAVVLKSIGAFHQTSYARTVTYGSPDAIPAGLDFHQDDAGGWVTIERAPLPGAHPEWSAQIWARQRGRLLVAPTGDRARPAGVLAVERAHVLGVATDAIYLDRDPGWPDDGAWGRFRLKGYTQRPRTMWRDVAGRKKLAGEAERELLKLTARAR